MTLEALTVLVLLNLLGTLVLWNSRRPKLKKKFVKSILNSKPIIPKHERPESITEQFRDIVDERDKAFFDDFRDFGDVVNWWCSDEYTGSPWRLQELADTELRISIGDSPDFGRRYSVFYNQAELGTLEIMPLQNFRRENPSIRTQIELDWTRLLSFEAVSGFLWTVANHVADLDPKSQDSSRALTAIQSSMAKVVWQSQRLSEFSEQEYGKLEFQLDGRAVWYSHRRDAQAFKEFKAARHEG